MSRSAHENPSLRPAGASGFRRDTLAWCWRLIRADSVVFGFTDHDRDITFDGTTFEAASGFTGTDIRQSIGLSVDNLDATGALQSDGLNEADLAAGLFDNARIEIWRQLG